jgi:hypothetical protein
VWWLEVAPASALIADFGHAVAAGSMDRRCAIPRRLFCVSVP